MSLQLTQSEVLAAWREICPPHVCGSIHTIQKIVAARYQITVEEMTADRRTLHIIRARHVAMYLARELTPQTTVQIGKRFRRDHTTVIHAWAKISGEIADDPDLAMEVKALADHIGLLGA